MSIHGPWVSWLLNVPGFILIYTLLFPSKQDVTHYSDCAIKIKFLLRKDFKLKLKLEPVIEDMRFFVLTVTDQNDTVLPSISIFQGIDKIFVTKTWYISGPLPALKPYYLIFFQCKCHFWGLKISKNFNNVDEILIGHLLKQMAFMSLMQTSQSLSK